MKTHLFTLVLLSGPSLAAPVSDIASSSSSCDDPQIQSSSNPSGDGTHIEDVFNVLTDDRWTSSCSKFLQPGSNDQNLKALDLGWRYLHALNEAAIAALSKEGYENDEENRRLATRFFGIVPGVARKRKGGYFKGRVEEVEGLPGGRLDGEKLGLARKWYPNVQKILDNRLPSPQRPWLFCDSDFMALQTGTDLVQNEDRYHVLKTQNSYMTVEDALAYHPHRQAVLQANWLFKSDIPATTYIPYSKQEFPVAVQSPAKGPAPFPLDSKGRSHECGTGVDGITRPARELKVKKTVPGLTWASEFVYRIIICPRSFVGHSRRPAWTQMLDTTPQPEGKVLDEMGIGALTLYHELFHLQTEVFQGTMRISPDPVVHRARCERSGDDRCVGGMPEKWYRSKSYFTTSKVEPNGAVTSLPNVAGAAESMFLALYDLASPVRDRTVQPTNPAGWKSHFSPENYVWFALAVYLHQKNKGDFWSSGVCRKRVETREESLGLPRGGRGRVP
ncbi:hypothetical protein CERZMDRAFT_95567 [Cercospora zeae-maydis SCOH1-5]|uniref:Lysine-specific metallo-endopeptidase domain-containing protein n=1 Tax=Cercospora zeae-maydis SCOH1-5 TaxID=717836 RepID=A0A6A6FLR6_9PEZI|nr:hypothetical protein CERZMDRAFT_95567 [Cercospora zeae-maydis SCOH1-5]